jgi:four helix bundle protein
MTNITNNYQSIKNKRIIDIHDRIYKFVIRVIEMTKALPKTRQNLVLIDQIIRSATSMGANDQEADGALTKKEFIHSYTIVRREGKETSYWLSVIADTNPEIESRLKDLQQEAKEIVKIVSSIIFKSKQRS